MNKTISEQLADFYKKQEQEKLRQENSSTAMINSRSEERKEKESLQRREESRKKFETMKGSTIPLPSGLRENSWEDEWKRK